MHVNKQLVRAHPAWRRVLRAWKKHYKKGLVKQYALLDSEGNETGTRTVCHRTTVRPVRSW